VQRVVHQIMTGVQAGRSTSLSATFVMDKMIVATGPMNHTSSAVSYLLT